ncbi:hypothetical protein [uncultured Tateyamaria sp.]|nr:hypothetical protein [uncultured Tateyamaria sp.]
MGHTQGRAGQATARPFFRGTRGETVQAVGKYEKASGARTEILAVPKGTS